MHARRADIILLVGVTVYALHYAATLDAWHAIDSVNLLIHEAGHVLFMPCGEFVSVLMGSGFQILFPATFMIYFLRRGELFSACTMLAWVGMSALNVSIYAGDAITMELPLIGGEHDWNYLLNTTGLITHTEVVARSIAATGFLCITLAIMAGIYTYIATHRRRTTATSI